MKFSEVATKVAQTKLTENGAMAYNTTNMGSLLDLFAQIGSLRPRTKEEIEQKFSAAFYGNELLATKMLFYAGDIRNGGLGERRTFRICLNWLARTRPDIAIKNIDNIGFYNRYDSLFELIGTDAESSMWEYVAKTLAADMKMIFEARKQGKEPAISLLAKWMPSENASSYKTKAMANVAIRKLRLTPRQYRQILSTLRKQLKITETFMSAKQWDKIYYPGVSSYAMKNYEKAFDRHDPARFRQFLESVKTGTQKINASTLYPYDLVHKYMQNNRLNDVVEAQWKALPDYIGDKAANFLIMADVSGSMYGRPIETSIGLAIYFAQHNHGDYHNLYMTFTDKPHFVRTDYNTLHDNVFHVMNTDIGYNTDLNAAFDYILWHATSHGVKSEDMPEALVVVSDMEIDPYFHNDASRLVRSRYNLDFVETQKLKFKEAGLKMPKLVLWNVEARNDTFLSQSDDIVFVSGQSASTFKHLIESLNGKTAYEFMLEVLNNPVYDRVKI